MMIFFFTCSPYRFGFPFIAQHPWKRIPLLEPIMSIRREQRCFFTCAVLAVKNKYEWRRIVLMKTCASARSDDRIAGRVKKAIDKRSVSLAGLAFR